MNKLPAKQIYLLAIIIIGIIALSVYSTYALFTFESSTSNIVNIHIPKSLQISENTYEYQQLVVEPNAVITTDVDIYNRYDYDICYSIWYKLVGNNIDESKVQIFENSNKVLTTSGLLTKESDIRVTITIINDFDKQIKVNLGTIGTQKNGDVCSINLENDKKTINVSYDNPKNLSETILEKKDEIKEEETNYLTYKNENKVINYKETDKIYISEKFTYSNELFTLEDSKYLTLKELIEEKYLENKNIYFCQNSDKCQIIYKLTTLEKKETKKQENNEIEISYDITNYDKLVGYSKGTSGIRKVNNQDYIFYGDNPNNFIYYNCKNNNDTNTCELWRIVGLFYNKETNKYNAKIIKNDSIGKYQFDSQELNNSKSLNSIYQDSTLYKYLNKEYKFINNYDMYIDEVKQELEEINSLDTSIKNMKAVNQIINSKVNLINLSDYLYTSSCQENIINNYNEQCLKSNWLNNIELEKTWTITFKETKEVNKETDDEDIETESNNELNNNTKYLYSHGNNINEVSANEYLEVRPVLFLKSRILLIDGDGTLENPYIIK